ncbi:PQQ-dependent sugar dehydrogenase [Candidatus Collierbacteria bacterium]|nr:PQQ-dependent sugar dehydrogenase [Candidatus Collierbacteria bacterium]
MKKILPFLALVILILGLAYVLYIRGFGFRTGNVEVQEIITSKSAGFRLEEVVSGLYVPWSIVFTSPDRMLVTERDGKIRIVERGRLLEKPLFVFTNVYTEKEAGLMGLTIDPDYSRNKYIYACLSYNKDGKPRIKVTRLKDNGISAVS